jgi:hypothetical protein
MSRIDLDKLDKIDDDAPVEPPGIGHNRPPSPTVERAGALVESAERVPETLTSEEEAGKAQELCDQLLSNRDKLDAELAEAIWPYQLVIDALRIQYRGVRNPVADALEAVRAKIGVWLDATGKSSVKGDLGKRAMSKRSDWRAEIVEPNLALRSYANNSAVMAAGRAARLKEIEAQGTRLAKQTKSEQGAPPGLRFFNKSRVL